MGIRALQIIILLTAVVGFVVPASAQIVPTDTLRNKDSLSNVTDSTAAIPDSLAGKKDSISADRFSLSTDSVYSTPVQQDNGFLPSQVEYTASDSIVGSIATGEAYLYNEAYVKYQDLTLKAGFIKINFNTSELYASGIKDTSGKIVQRPIFTENGKSYRADEMRYNFDTKKAYIKRVITQEGEGYLHGEVVKKVDEKTYYIKNASFTTCNLAHPHFRIVTPKAKVISGNKIFTKFAYLEVLDIPTPLMVPFGFFPTSQTRKSGIILPSYGRNEYRGYFLTNGGFYWAASDYYDVTLTGDIYTQGGYGLKAETNYNKRYKFSGGFSVAYNKIKYGRPEFAEYAAEAYDDRSDFSITWNHNQDAKARPDFRFNSSVNIASSNYYKVTSTDANSVLQNRLNSSISISKTWSGTPFNLTASLNHSQNIQTKDLTLKLPEVNFSVNRLYPFKRKVAVGKKKWFEEIGISYNMSGKNEIQTKYDKPIFTPTVFRDSSHNGIDHRIPITASYKVFKHFVFNPSINYEERWYLQQSVWGLDSNNRVAVIDTNTGFYGVRDFSTSANLSTKLYGTIRMRKGFLRAVRHTMTPTVGLSYRPDFSEDFWGYYQSVTDTAGNTKKYNKYNYGIYGSPSAGKSGTVNFGLQNTLEAKVHSKQDSTGLKKIKLLERFSLNTSYNMAATEYQWAPLTLSMSSSALNGLVNLNYHSTYDFYGYDTEKGERVPEYAYKVNHKFLRTTGQNFSMGLNLSQGAFQKSAKSKSAPAVQPSQDQDKKEGEIDNLGESNNNPLNIQDEETNYYNPNTTVDFTVPWSININYSLGINYNGLTPTLSQSLTASGDFTLTKNWRVGFNTGYDFKAKDFTYTSFDFYRDLHCWELRCSWVPFGYQQSYTLTIRVKSSILKDLKVQRQRGIGDFQQ